MIKQIYSIYGLQAEADERTLSARLAEAMPELSAHVSYLCATVTVVSEEGMTEAEEKQLVQLCADAGYSLQTPPDVRQASQSERKHPGKHAEWRGIPVSVFIASLCAVLVFSVLFTFAIATDLFNARLRDQFMSEDGTIISGNINDSSQYDELDLIRDIFEAYSIQELDEEEMMTALLRSYVTATGDLYAAYYTAEELEAMFAEDSGDLVGIGVTVVNSVIPANGVDNKVLTVISTYRDSPAYEAGILPGDIIYSLIDENGKTVYVDAVGQTQAINMIRGQEGSEITLTILRPIDATSYEAIPITMERRAIVTHSVEYKVSYADPTIGIVEISEFNMTTPPQFREAMDALIARGCDKFIFDLRYNGGGELKSLMSVLSTMLQPGDPMIYTVDKQGNEDVDVVKAVIYDDDFKSCSVKAEDIGKYRGYPMVVLTNEYTASAAELFTANLRDYGLATQIGVKTFGKGCMQTILDLSYFGVEGGLKLTTARYLPPSKVDYHDIGLTPENGEVHMDESLFEKYSNVYLIPDEEDNQLTAAIDWLKGQSR